ncbi:hypothetical protein [Paenibacillus sp. WLX2291]|uniref:hypothetical protein n=1 Tax=Paenibacillus sp. WLX2291 TaxID=3296934 RepID=UPI003983E091
MSYRIEYSAVEAYCQLFTQNLYKSIHNLCDSEYTINTKENNLILNFFEKNLTVIKVENESIVDIFEINYDVFSQMNLLLNLAA